MAETLPYVAAATLALAGWWIGLVRLGVFLPDDVRAWRRLALLRGHALPQTRLERAVGGSRFVRAVQSELDLERLLARAGRADTPLGFLGKTGALALTVFAGSLFVDAVGRAATGSWPVPPWVTLVVGILFLPLGILDLRSAARRSSETTSTTLGDMLMPLAVITDSRGLQPHDAIRLLSRCAREPNLARLIDQGGYRRLAGDHFRSTVDMYRSIAVPYGVQLFGQLADAMATTNVGVPEREAFTRLALAVYEQRLTQARVRAARAKVLVTLPVAAMLVPLLLLIAAPTFQAISRGLGGG